MVVLRHRLHVADSTYRKRFCCCCCTFWFWAVLYISYKSEENRKEKGGNKGKVVKLKVIVSKIVVFHYLVNDRA